MFGPKNFLGWLVRTVFHGLRFGIINRDIRPSMALSCIEYWRLCVRTRFDRRLSWRWNPAKPFPILGLRLRSFSPEDLLCLVNEIFLDRTYAFAPIRDNPVIIDCGSNVGVSVLYFKKVAPNARVIAFEPDRRTFDLLCRNISGNAATDVALHNAAVCLKRGEVTFYASSENPGSLHMSTVRERVQGTAHTVACVQLSDYIQEPVDLLKIDIEGAELDVMSELAFSGKLSAVASLIIEYHHHIRPNDDQLSRMLRLLEENSFGYSLHCHRPEVPHDFQDIQLNVYRRL
jgi:FkbM family methyltransferase